MRIAFAECTKHGFSVMRIRPSAFKILAFIFDFVSLFVVVVVDDDDFPKE